MKTNGSRPRTTTMKATTMKHDVQSARTLRPRYPEWDRFATWRAKLDPHGTFRNEYLDRVLGPVAQ